MSIVGGCPVLERFNIEGCTKMSDKSAKFIAEYSTEMKVYEVILQIYISFVIIL
jgi:hypothetical protein